MKAFIATLFLLCAGFIGSGQKDSTTSMAAGDSVKVQLKLVKVELTPDCGIFTFTTAQKFELLLNAQPFFPKKYVIVLQQCPEFLGRDFFVQGKIYDAVLSTATDEAGALNSHRHEKLPTYWCRKISPSIN